MNELCVVDLYVVGLCVVDLLMVSLTVDLSDAQSYPFEMI
jgi:hypothetical protein